MIQPTTAMLLAAVLLSEAPSAVQMLGVAVVLGGIAVATLGPRPEPAAAMAIGSPSWLRRRNSAR
jgi:drug/metabolite transporter (DMT)-like permease